jgi:bacillithiol synthase
VGNHDPIAVQEERIMPMSGELAVQSECLAFADIPHTTPLFKDYLAWAPQVQRFYARPPRLSSWVAEQAASLNLDADRRKKVADILERQNRSWGASNETLDNISRLRNGASCVVTGQQVGLFGGPLFSIFKAVSALQLARESRSAGVNCIPVFWLATEDHDLAEVNNATVFGPNYSLALLQTTAHARAEAPICEVEFGPEITNLVEQAAELLGDSEAIVALRESYQPGRKFGDAFAKLFTNLLRPWGVVMLDASDPELHAIAEPIYRAAVDSAPELDNALLHRGKELVAAGYHEQVKVTARSTLLFALQDGARTAVHLNGNRGGDEFRIGDTKISREELLKQISSHPENFSANVLMRPVVQDYLLPTVAYVGGPAEIAYFAQAAVVYERFLGKITPVLPRFSATLIEPKTDKLLKRYQVELRDLFHGLDVLRQKLADHTLPADLHDAFDVADKSLQDSLNQVLSSLEKLDSTLVKAAEKASAKMHYQLKRLRARAARAQIARQEILVRHAVELCSALYPHKTLQEREIAGIYFLARHGLGLIERLLEAANGDCADHQVLYL